MEYPYWQLSTLAGGFWVAFISVIHVYVAQFAVGGGLFLPLVEMRAARENNPFMLAYVKKHAKFFLLLTMVFGGVSGVGIWFIIALLSPQATSTLIHVFVWGWATEWVFFVIEIAALLVYYYAFDRMERRTHILVGWIYFAAGFASLFIINGILTFMLDTGRWPETHSFWSGFFNPGFWPSTAFRTVLSFMIAGLFGFVTATRVQDEKTRLTLVRCCAKWTLISFVLCLLTGWWSLTALTPEAQALVAQKAGRVALFLKVFVVAGGLASLGALLLATRLPQTVGPKLALLVLLVGLIAFGGFESAREAGRKPWLIPHQTYSNSLRPAFLAPVEAEGLLGAAKWVQNRTLTPDNLLAAGQELYELQCASCHSIGGPMNDILPRTAKFTHFGMGSMLNGLGKVNAYMPPFFGTEAERRALAAYIVTGLHGRKDTADKAVEPKAQDLPTPPFDKNTNEYVLLTWNTLGMHCISDSDPYWILLPPANDLRACLIRRGPGPQAVTEGVTLSYAVEPGFEYPAKQVEFWKHAKSLFGKDLPENVGLAGEGLSGQMKLDPASGLFGADLIPVVPYPAQGGYNPYPLFTVEARDTASGKLLASTKVVAPTSTEMGCRNCHGGPWKKDGVAGISDQAAADVLTVHDRMNGTTLLADAKAGKPRLCQSCHPDPVLGSQGDPKNHPGLMNLPAALHGFHATHLTNRGEEACHTCHPNRPDGPTRCLRGVHGTIGITCVRCHGFMEDHATSLLKGQEGKRSAARLLGLIKPRSMPAAEINGRTPWLQEPDCLNCHKDFTAPDLDTCTAFNTWTAEAKDLYRMRKDDMSALPCAACHNSPHAEFPALNAYGDDRDNVQPLQYQGLAAPIGGQKNCPVCHREAKDFPAHHPNMLR